MNDAITRTLDLLGKEVRPAPEPRLRKSEFCKRFVDRMVKRAGFTHFDDGLSVEEYAKDTAPTYFSDPDQRADGPEECADADMSYWGEE